MMHDIMGAFAIVAQGIAKPGRAHRQRFAS
jgi:hypothetical protein